MNHLAHLLLAGRDPDEVIGAIMGDFIRGRLASVPVDSVELGIRLHRKIDAFTDAHPRTLESRRRFAPSLRRYAGLVVDLAYDHYLARHWHRFSDETLDAFIERVYPLLRSRCGDLPTTLQARLPAMLEADFLRRSVALADLHEALSRLGRRLRSRPDLTPALRDIERYDSELENDFLAFFPALSEHVREQRARLRSAIEE